MFVLSATKRLQWYCLKSGQAAPLHILCNSVFLSYSTTQRYTVRVTESDVEIAVINKWMEHLMNVITSYLLVLSRICCPHSNSICLHFLRFISLSSSYRQSTLHSLCHPLHTIFATATTQKQPPQKSTNQWAGWAILGISTFSCSCFMKKRTVKQSFSNSETKRHTYVTRGACRDALRPTHSTLTTPNAISLTCSIRAMPLWSSKAANYCKGRIAINIQYFTALNIGYPNANADAVSLSSLHLIRNIHLLSFKTLAHFTCWNSGSAKSVRTFIHVQQTESKMNTRHRGCTLPLNIQFILW